MSHPWRQHPSFSMGIYCEITCSMRIGQYRIDRFSLHRISQPNPHRTVRFYHALYMPLPVVYRKHKISMHFMSPIPLIPLHRMRYSMQTPRPARDPLCNFNIHRETRCARFPRIFSLSPAVLVLTLSSMAIPELP